jgi:hypothetical protein
MFIMRSRRVGVEVKTSILDSVHMLHTETTFEDQKYFRRDSSHIYERM